MLDLWMQDESGTVSIVRIPNDPASLEYFAHGEADEFVHRGGWPDGVTVRVDCWIGDAAIHCVVKVTVDHAARRPRRRTIREFRTVGT